MDGDAGLRFLMVALLEGRTDRHREGILMVRGEIGEEGDHYKGSALWYFPSALRVTLLVET